MYVCIGVTTSASFTGSKQNMHFQQCSLVGVLKRVMVFVLLITFLVCGEKEEPSVVGLNYQPPTSMPEKQPKQKQQHSFGTVYISQKRKVPNASDPLHNR